MADAYGASLEAWHHWSETLGLVEHLLPVVANPQAVISPDSTMKLLGKTPSRYNFRHEAAGFAKWTEMLASHKDVGKWELEDDYGICVQARAVRALDIDVPGVRASRAILKLIDSALPLHFFPRRYREGTGKVLLPFRMAEPCPKRMLHVEGGIIEVLGDGQQWIAESSYLTGKVGKQRVDGRYLWAGGWPKRLEDIPELTLKELDDLCAALEMMFCIDLDGWSIARQRREGQGVDRSALPGLDDPVAEHLIAKGVVRDTGRAGELYIECPFSAEHTSDSGPTETVYYTAGTGGYERGHFKCLHAHCIKREDDDFIEALGWSPDMSDAPELPEEDEPGTEIEERPAPRYIIDKQGRKENRAFNHELFLRDVDAAGIDIAWDDYSAQIVWRKAEGGQWHLFTDEHYSQIVRQMDRNGFVPQSPSSIRAAVHSHAMLKRLDLFAEWGRQLPKWDGVERCETFWIDYGKAEDTSYIRAVGRYSWTAQAGRMLDPGCQVDMVPILVGAQGARKTSLIRAIAPHPEMFIEINLLERDDDTTRKMRGKAVAELGELRGMHARDKEDVKAFITRRDEEWVPKYQEFTKRFKRRFVFYGSTNRDDFLADETGERRYLPFHVSDDLDVEGVERDRLQLWAEAIALYRQNGVMWQDAERLAAGEHAHFKEEDAWTAPIRNWLLEDDALNGGAPADREYQWGTDDALAALGIKASQINRGHQIRVGAVLTALGCTKKRVWGEGWRYRAYREKLVGEVGDA